MDGMAAHKKKKEEKKTAVYIYMKHWSRFAKHMPNLNLGQVGG